MDTVFEIFAAMNAAIDSGVMTQELLSSVVLAIAAFIAAQWMAGKVTDMDLRRANREMAGIAMRWRSVSQERAMGIAWIAQGHARRQAAYRYIPASHLTH